MVTLRNYHVLKGAIKLFAKTLNVSCLTHGVLCELGFVVQVFPVAVL